MRSASAELIAFLATHTVGVKRHLVTITPRTGSALVTSPVYWTDHSSDIVFDGHTFLRGGEGTTAPTIEFGQRREKAGSDPGSLDLSLGCGTGAVFNGVRLPVAAASKMFDGAIVKVERVFGEASIDLTLGALHVFEGLVADARPTSTMVELDIESGLAALNVEIPRRCYQPSCTNILFDAQCGISKAAKTATGSVLSTGSSTLTTFETDCDEATGYFDLGVLTFDAGTMTPALRGVSRAVRSYVRGTTGDFTVDRPLPAVPLWTDGGGDTFSVYPGCPKTLAACETKFGTDNRAHFRGFPFLPRKGDLITPYRGILSTPVNGVKVAEDARGYGQPIPIVYGRRRIGGTLIYMGTEASGMIPAEWAVCEGPIAGVDKVYRESNSYSFNWDLKTGTRPTQTAWTQLPAGRDLTYPGVAILPAVAPIENGRIAEYEWEVRGKLDATGGADDAHPADIIQDLLPNAGPLADPDDGFYGAGFPFAIETDIGLDGNAASSCRRYVAQETATGEGDQLWLSLALTEKRQAIDVLDDICESINCEPLWLDGKLWIIPRQDVAVGTFAPVTSIRYAFTEGDMEGGGNKDPVSVRIDPETESFNICAVTFPERSPEGAATDSTLEYQDSTVEDPDPVDVALRGERPSSPVRFSGITRRKHAVRISRILAQRQIRTRQEIEFTGKWYTCRLSPLDLVSVTDTLFPYTSQPFQIREIEEDMETGAITYRCQEWTAGVNHATSYTTQSSDGASTQWDPFAAEAKIRKTAASAWATGSAGTSGTWRGIAENPNSGRIIVINTAGGCFTSDDGGRSWASRATPVALTGIAWCDDRFIAVGTNTAASTTDGETWTDLSSAIGSGSFTRVVWTGSYALAMNGANPATAFRRSNDGGASWSSVTVPSARWVAIASDGAGGVVALAQTGSNIMRYSTDHGANWSTPSGSAPDYATGGNFGVAYGNGRWVVLGSGSGTAIYSDDGGATWQAGTCDGADNVYDAAWGGGVFVAIGSLSGVPANDRVFVSTDGAAWERVDTVLNATPARITFCAGPSGRLGRFLMVGTYAAPGYPMVAFSQSVI